MDTIEKKPRLRSRDILPDEEKIPQPSPIDLGLGETPFVRPAPQEILIEKSPIENDQAARLAFNEEPVSIIAHASSDPNAPLYVEGWVNGVGVERWLDNLGWVRVGSIPTGEEVTVKRKYVDQWLRSRYVNIRTLEDKADGSEPRNEYRLSVSGSHQIQITNDANPRGAEWARQLMRMPARVV